MEPETKRWIRWTYNPDKAKVGTSELVDIDAGFVAVDEGRAVYTYAPAPESTVPVKPSTAVKADKIDKAAQE